MFFDERCNSSIPVHNCLYSKKTRILLFLFSLPNHPSSAVSYDPRQHQKRLAMARQSAEAVRYPNPKVAESESESEETSDESDSSDSSEEENEQSSQEEVLDL